MTTISSTNPATGETKELTINETTTDEVNALALRAAAAALDLAGRPLVWRAGMLRAMANELEADATNLVALAHDETALPLPRLEGELRRTAFQLRFFADVVEDGAFLDASLDNATDSPMGPLPDLRRVNTPIGAVGVFGSSNFPFAFSVPGGDTASALAAGCPVVIKAHPAHPATSAATFAALKRGARESEAPEGTLALVYGFDAGTALVEAPAISAVGFTGSVGAGLALWQRANARPIPIPFFGELGSANPLVVTTSAAVERGAEIGTALAGSMTLGAGQFCTKPGLIFVPTGDAGDALVGATVDSLSELGEFTMLTAGIADHFRSGATSIANVSDVRPRSNGGVGTNAHTSAQLYEVDASRFEERDAYALREECFGPLALIVRYESNDALRRALEASEPALTFSLFSADGDPDSAWLVALGASRAGRIIVNGFPTGVGVSWSMQHGGPWPATTSAAATSVGAAAIGRWLRPVSFQGVENSHLPPALQESNPLGIPRRINGNLVN
ncbi:MAG TPA: aldehyde dehydrogenase (NADP(+)) [Acidimicrobiales bacterium]